MDRAGCLFGLRVNGAPVTIKITSYEVDPETLAGVNRDVTTDASCLARSVPTTSGGILRARGYVDPLNAGSALVLASNTSVALTAVKFLLDVSETGGSRHGYNVGDCLLVPGPIVGESRPGGMQEQSFEIHSQAGMVYATNLT